MSLKLTLHAEDEVGVGVDHLRLAVPPLSSIFPRRNIVVATGRWKSGKKRLVWCKGLRAAPCTRVYRCLPMQAFTFAACMGRQRR